jgi:hypothetical protein
METRTIDLGPCHCPGTPHERDEAVIRKSIDPWLLLRVLHIYVGEYTRALAGDVRQGGLAMATLMAMATVSWNRVDELGGPIPISGADDSASLAAIDGLPPEQAQALLDALGDPAQLVKAIVVDAVWRSTQ